MFKSLFKSANHLNVVVANSISIELMSTKSWSVVTSRLVLQTWTLDVSVSLQFVFSTRNLRSAARTSPSAFWASWADSLPMVERRHPEVATHIVEMLSSYPSTPCLEAAVQAEGLHALPGFTPPSWHELALGARPLPREPEENEPGTSCTGGNTRLPHVRSVSTEAGSSRPCPTPNEPGPVSKWSWSCSPSQCVRQVLRRGSTLPCSALFSCGVFVSHSPHPSASAGVAVHSTLLATTGQFARGLGCWEGGDLRWRAPLRDCREGGARVTANVMVRDMDVAANLGDARKLEIVPCSVECSWRSIRRCDGSALPRCANFDGADLQVARRKERAYPEVAGPHGRARLVVLVG